MRHIVRSPHPVLSTPAAEVDPAAVRELAADLLALMRDQPGCVGIAAPQVGEPVRLFVLDVSGHPKAHSCTGPVVLANPVLVSASGRDVGREGCLSVPDLTGDVPRATNVLVTGVDPRTLEPVNVVADAFEARALQHELDHLAGLLFLDRVSSPDGIHPRRVYR